MVGSILLVDDDPVLREILGEGLSRFGHEVHGVGLGQEAIQLIRQRSFDSALIDFELPDMTGVALYYIMKSFRARMAQATVFISGHSGIRTLLPRAATFLEKPFTASDADIAVSMLMARTLARQD